MRHGQGREVKKDKNRRRIDPYGSGNELILKDPAPIVPVNGGSDQAMTFTPMVWCKNADYWGAKFSAEQNIAEALKKAGTKAPTAMYKQIK